MADTMRMLFTNNYVMQDGERLDYHQLTAIDWCCDKIRLSDMFQITENDDLNEYYESSEPIVALMRVIPDYDQYDREYIRIDYCPFCGAEFVIIVNKAVDVTKQNDELEKLLKAINKKFGQNYTMEYIQKISNEFADLVIEKRALKTNLPYWYEAKE